VGKKSPCPSVPSLRGQAPFGERILRLLTFKNAPELLSQICLHTDSYTGVGKGEVWPKMTTGPHFLPTRGDKHSGSRSSCERTFGCFYHRAASTEGRVVPYPTSGPPDTPSMELGLRSMLGELKGVSFSEKSSQQHKR
jgi:hypothetical protein